MVRGLFLKQRPGFSLIEALVVLAIGGMALSIIFTIGVKAGDTGFGLGRRAMAAADADVTLSDIRTLLRSVALRPPVAFVEGVDVPVVGDAQRFETDVITERATQCAPRGWTGRMILVIAPSEDGSILTCQTTGEPMVLMRFGQSPAAFAYSTDGQTWSSRYTNFRQRPRGLDAELAFRSETIWIRLAARPQVDIVEIASSGQPQLWTRPDVG